MEIRYFILEGKRPVSTDLQTWANWFETAERRVKYTRVGKYFVSTVFLGLDHGLPSGPNEAPVLFETMAFTEKEKPESVLGIPLNSDFLDIQERCCTWEQAEAQHQGVVDMLLASSPNLDVEILYEYVDVSAEWLKEHVGDV